jgi:hypothetical protein
MPENKRILQDQIHLKSPNQNRVIPLEISEGKSLQITFLA